MSAVGTIYFEWPLRDAMAWTEECGNQGDIPRLLSHRPVVRDRPEPYIQRFESQSGKEHHIVPLARKLVPCFICRYSTFPACPAGITLRSLR